MNKTKTPIELKKTGKAFYEKVISEYELADAHDLERLSMASKCLDENADAEKLIKKDGAFIRNRYRNIIEHPAAKSIRDNRLLFVKIIRELALDITTPEDSRPPRQY